MLLRVIQEELTAGRIDQNCTQTVALLLGSVTTVSHYDSMQ